LQETGDNEYASTVFIQDLKELTMSHLTIQNFSMMHMFTDIDSLNYPETVRKVFIINAPSAWAFGWKMSKSFLDPNTIEKVAILDHDSTALLKEIINPACLPQMYGVELDYKITGGGSAKEVKALLPQLFKADITTELSVTINVEKPTLLTWQFRLRNDIMFGVFYQTAKDDKKEPVPGQEPKKEDTDNVLVQGLLSVKKAGYYTISWDNSSNWTKRKLSYLIFLDGVPLEEKDFVGIVKK